MSTKTEIVDCGASSEICAILNSQAYFDSLSLS
jgi:hypothetical protein